MVLVASRPEGQASPAARPAWRPVRPAMPPPPALDKHHGAGGGRRGIGHVQKRASSLIAKGKHIHREKIKTVWKCVTWEAEVAGSPAVAGGAVPEGWPSGPGVSLFQ